MTDDRAHLERQITAVKRRMKVLQEQRAGYGELAVPAHIVTELEDAAAELAELAAQLRQLDEQPDTGEVPYVGLDPFQESNADIFFGREELVATMVERVRRAPFLAVLGPSGSGKSSVVQAGLIPQLKKGVLPDSTTWRYSIFRPGDRPLDRLAAELTKLQGGDLIRAIELSRDLATSERALLLAADLVLDRARGQRLVLVVDQCEELWTLAPTTPDERGVWLTQQQRPFIQQLLAAVTSTHSSLLVMLTLRADFLDRAAEHPSLARAISDHNVIVSPMGSADLRAVIVEPARIRGVTFEPGLVDELIEQAQDQSGSLPFEQVQGRSGYLPLLEYSLLELWKRREGTLLTWDAYRRIGGVKGALAAQTDALLREYYPTEAQQKTLRALLLRLVQTSEDGIYTRRRVPFTDLVAGAGAVAEVQTLLQPLIDKRLLTTNRDEQTGVETVEITHEALIRAWPTLGQWIDEARDDLRFQLRLEQAAKEWQESDQNEDLLWSGLRLANATAWQARANPRLNEREHRFLAASDAAQQARREAEEQARHEREALLAAQAEAQRQRAEEQQKRAEEQQVAAQRLRRRALYLIGALLAALLAFVVAVVLFNQSQQRGRIAKARELAAAAVSNLNVDPQRSLLLASAAISATAAFSEPVVAEAQEALQQAVQASRVRHILQGHSAGLQAVAVSPDGARLAAAGNEGTIIVWDAASGLELHRMASGAAVHSLDWSFDGKRIVAAGADGSATRWNVDSGVSEQTFDHDSSVNAVAWNPADTLVATTTDSGMLTIWQPQSDAPQQEIAFSDTLTDVAWSPDGASVAAGSSSGSVAIWDAASGDPTLTISDTGGPVEGIAWSPDGAQLAIASESLAVTLWDATNGEPMGTLKGHSSSVYDVAWSPDGSALASASADGTAKLWNLSDEREVLTLYGHSEAVTDVRFSPDGTTLLTGSLDRTARVWSLALAPPDGTLAVAYDPGGAQLASAAADGVRLWDAATGQGMQLVAHEGGANTVAWNPDGARLASGGRDGSVQLWTASSDQPPQILSGHEASVGRVAWSPDGSRVASASDDTTIRIWDANTGSELHLLSGHSNWVYALAWSPDGVQVASADLDGKALVWDALTGKELLVLSDTRTAEFTDIAWSPDGRILALADENGTASLLDAATGRPRSGLRHGLAINALAWNPDGTRIATAGRDKLVRVWDAATGAQLFALPHPAEVYSLAWSHDGSHIATAAADGVARIFPLDLDALRALARERTVRMMTGEECRQYQLDCL